MPGIVNAIFAHPDDEVLACGASLAKHVDAGDKVRILILATGLASRGDTAVADIGELQDQARAAADVLGAEEIYFGDFPDNQMDTVPLLSVVQKVEEFLSGGRPDLLYTHHGGDLNIDHRIVHQAVVTACRPLPGLAPHEIRACEINSSTEWGVSPLVPFESAIFEPVAETLDRKVDALACYPGELRDWPHPRSSKGVRTLARLRGMQCGYEAAEAFMLIRKVTS